MKTTILHKTHNPQEAYARLYVEVRKAYPDTFEGSYAPGHHHFIAGEGDSGVFSVYRQMGNTIIALDFPDGEGEPFVIVRVNGCPTD